MHDGKSSEGTLGWFIDSAKERGGIGLWLVHIPFFNI